MLKILKDIKVVYQELKKKFEMMIKWWISGSALTAYADLGSDDEDNNFKVMEI